MNRKLVLGAIPAIMLGAIVAPLVIYWSNLPNPMATHWGLSGQPNGHMSPTLLLLVMGGIFIAIWAAIWRVTRRIPYDLPSFAAGLLGVGGLLAAVQWIVVLANRNQTDWTEAGTFNGLHLILVLVAAIGFGYVGWKLAGDSAQAAARGVDGPTIDLAATETAIWSGSGRGPLLIAIGAVVVIAAIAMWSWTSLALLIVAVIVLLFAEVRATVSDRGVAISLGWLGIPSWVIPMARIRGAEVEDVSPMSYGGWGYRLRPGVKALVVRGGPGLRLVREDEADLVLTVDDPETGAGLINSLLARR